MELYSSVWVHSKSQKPPKRGNTGSDNPNDYVPLLIFQFYIFEKSQVEHNHLDCQIVFGNRLHYWLLQLVLNQTLLW